MGIVGPEYSPPASVESHLEGHMNVFNSGDVFFPEPLDQDEFYDLLAKTPSLLAQWNHPSLQYAGNHFRHFKGWTPARNQVISMLEIYSEDQGRMESAYQLALDRNWRVAPIASSDTHSANWATGYEARTAVLATELTREAIFAAWRARRCYATENRNLRVEFEINGYPMGAVIPLASRYDMTLRLTDPDTAEEGDRLRLAEIVSRNGAVVESKVMNSHQAVWTHRLPNGEDATYFRARVRNAKGQIAWTAPIWLPASQTTARPVAGIGDQINLAWKPAARQSDSYEIWRRSSADSAYKLWKQVSPDLNTYADENALPGTVYFYKVRAIAIGKAAPFSNEATAMADPPDATPPAVPKGLKILPNQAGRVEFSFPPASDDRLLMGYGMVRDAEDLHLGKFAGFTDRLIEGVNQVRGVDVDYATQRHRVLPGATYKYQVYAIDSSGNRSALSEALVVKVPN